VKRFVASVLTMLLTPFIVMAGTASAATSTIVKVNIPFEFSVGDRTFPAGDYSLVKFQPNLIALYNSRGHNVDIALAYVQSNLEPPTDTTVKFQVVGGRHMLAEVWTAGESTGAVFAVKGAVSREQQMSSTMLRHDGASRKIGQAN
jgi:hypothetical protein